METRKKEIISGIIVIIYLINLANAANIGISPASIEFKNVLRGGYSEKNLIISADSEDPIIIELSTRGEISKWINFSDNNFSVSKSKLGNIKLYLNPPSDVENGNYSGFVRVITSSLGQNVENHAVGVIKSALELYISVEIIDREIVICSIKNLEALDTEKGDDIIFSFDFVNNGNVRIKPYSNIKIYDQDEISIVQEEEFNSPEVLPSREEKVVLRMKSDDLTLGQYFIDILLPDCYVSEKISLDILAPGALKADGSIIGIVHNKTAQAGDTVPIKIIFRNTGQKEIDAKFKGKIMSGDKIVQVLDSEEMKIPINQDDFFNFYFTPTKSGRYVISGRVYYSGKKTFEASSILEVLSVKSNLRSILMIGIYLLLLTVIGFLFFKIKNERRVISHKMRMIKLKR